MICRLPVTVDILPFSSVEGRRHLLEQNLGVTTPREALPRSRGNGAAERNRYPMRRGALVFQS